MNWITYICPICGHEEIQLEGVEFYCPHKGRVPEVQPTKCIPKGEERG